MLLNSGANIEAYLYLINHSLRHLNIKKVNMEIWEDISLHIARPYTLLTADPRFCALAFEGIANICLIQFNYDMKIREFTSWLTESISALVAKDDSSCKAALAKFNDFLNSEYAKNKQESIRFTVE